jgi:L-seryl-tRNA(Ser) seleniumtransferase
VPSRRRSRIRSTWSSISKAGDRGERDSHVERRLTKLTGADAALVVNNNAAAVYLTLNTLALRREVPVSRGELIEIGGAFRLPDIMARAGVKMVEIGTTNRTHLKDYAGAITPRTAALMKVHTSNYAVQGFTAAVPEEELARLAHEHKLPLITDLGSGMLVIWRTTGCRTSPRRARRSPPAPTSSRSAATSCSAGRKPASSSAQRPDRPHAQESVLKRALRVDQDDSRRARRSLALYSDPERLRRELPTLSFLARPLAEIEEQARRLLPPVAGAVAGKAEAAF